MHLRTVDARRYVTPLREGGSLPAIVEADDAGLYVLKVRGAGQGPKALIAELIGGEIGRDRDLQLRGLWSHDDIHSGSKHADRPSRRIPCAADDNLRPALSSRRKEMRQRRSRRRSETRQESEREQHHEEVRTC